MVRTRLCELPPGARLEGYGGGGQRILEGGLDDVREINSQVDDVLQSRGR